MKYIGFIPCRAGSVRVQSKNTKPFAGNREGLVGRKLRQMAAVRQFEEIIVSTDDELVKNTCADVADDLKDRRITVLDRPPELALSGTLDDFVTHVASLREHGVLFWTHVTSPFFASNAMTDAITAYEINVLRGEHDSLMGVTPIRDFFWRGGVCISHDRKAVKWPQTQDIAPFHEVNSSVFMYDIAEMRRKSDRIGDAPFLFEMDKRTGFDVDWPEDFHIAEIMAHDENVRLLERAY